MALLQLPPELLLHILGHLGFPFFAQDIRRLTLSKQWYDLAWPVFARDLQLKDKSLVRFTHDDAAAARSAPHLSTVQLRLHYDISKPLTHRNADAAYFSPGLTKLAAAVRRCPRMRSLDVEMRLGAMLDGWVELMAQPLADLLFAGRLTSLTFDTANCLFKHTPGSGTHFCHSINSLLPSLRRLRCRMQSVCKSLLEPPPRDAPPLALEEVIVNLSISQIGHASTSYGYSNRCGDLFRIAFGQFKDAMEAQATALAARLRQPRMVRVITHVFPSLDIYAFDALTGKRVRLENNIEWDAEGVAVDDAQRDGDESDETDLFEGDLPSTPPFVVL
jgi:hypothetical protein